MFRTEGRASVNPLRHGIRNGDEGRIVHILQIVDELERK